MKQTVADELAVLDTKRSNGEITDSEFETVQSMILNRVDGPPPKVSRKAKALLGVIVVASGAVALWYIGWTFADIRDFLSRLWVMIGVTALFCMFLIIGSQQ